MLFSSISFLYYFLPIVLIAYYLAPKSIKNMVLLLASLVFYALPSIHEKVSWTFFGGGELSYFWLLVFEVVWTYVFGILIEKCRQEKCQNIPWSKICMLVSVGISLGLLGYFKYADFFIINVNAATGMSLPLLKVVLPIGISFYTFQLISYIMDVYWGKIAAQKNLITLATYITMFPQLIAGPIVRYSDVEKQLQDRKITFEKIAYGIRRFVLGLGKKVLIANVLGEFCAAFQDTDEKSVLFFWAYAVAVSLQIYFDFSGYSDMAIGLGSMLGFHFMENFNYPFISKSATEFWRRWHISLGTWFRDYVYIPLGGSRCSVTRNLINILIVWMLTGFWHGAEWTFVVWGLYFGIFLIIEKTVLLKYLEKIPLLGHVYILLLSIISFVIFDAASFTEALGYITAMFGGSGLPFMTEVTGYYISSYFVIFLIAVIGATPLPKQLFEKISAARAGGKIVTVMEPFVMILLIIIATAYLVDGSFNPFLYFRF